MRKTFTFQGKRYSVSGNTPEELYTRLLEKKKSLESGQILLSKSTTVKEWTEKWLQAYKRPVTSDASFYAYECRVKIYVYPRIGSYRLMDVKPLHLQQIINDASRYSRDHIKKIKYTIEQVFDSAMKNKLLLVNPAEDLVLPAAKTSQRRSITEYERKHILNVAKKNPSGLWIKTMLYCGLRPSETAALQGRHINLKEKTITIEAALKRHDNTIGSTKTAAGTRLVPIPDLLVGEFSKLKRPPFEYIFQNRNGSHMTVSGMRKRWLSFKFDLNVSMGCKTDDAGRITPPYPVAEDLVPYCLRHTYCTDLEKAGVPINIAKYLMGHSDIYTTSRIYTHTDKESVENARILINQRNSNKAIV